jgi:hypothetical protein
MRAGNSPDHLGWVSVRFRLGVLFIVAGMRLLATIENAFQTRRSSARLASAFELWKKPADTPLARFEDLEELISWYRREAEPADEAETTPVLTTLCKLAGGGDQDAALLLLWLLLPLLWWASSDPDYVSALTPDEIDAELVVGMWEAVVGVARQGSDSPKKEIVSELLDAGRRRALAAAQQSRQWELHREELTELTPSPVAGSANAARLIEQARDNGVITDVEADLIVWTRLSRLPLAEAGAAQNLKADTARKRRNRAEARLLAWIAEGPLPSRHLAAPAVLTSLLDLETHSLRDRAQTRKEVEAAPSSADEQPHDERGRAP